MAKEKKEWDYKTLSIPQMYGWIVENKPSDEKEFCQTALTFDENNNPVKDKYKMSEAKKYFYNHYKDELTFKNVPTNGRKKSTFEKMVEALSK